MTQTYRFVCSGCGTEKLEMSSGDPRRLSPTCRSCGEEMDLDGVA